MLAVRACIRGEASADQQRMAMQFIAAELCRRFDSPYVPGAGMFDQGVETGRHLVGVWISNCNDDGFIAAKRAEAEQRERQAQIIRRAARGKNGQGQKETG